MNTSDTLTVSKTFTVGELWEAIWGCDGAGMVYWCNKIRKPNGHDIHLWKYEGSDLIPNPQDVKIYDTTEVKPKTYVVTVEDMRRGYELALQQGQQHCGGHALDIDDYDGCFGDIVIQYAIWGKLIYGQPVDYYLRQEKTNG